MDVLEAERDERCTHEEPVRPVFARVVAVARLGAEADELVGDARQGEVADGREVQRVMRERQVLEVCAVAADDQAERVAAQADRLEGDALVDRVGARVRGNREGNRSDEDAGGAGTGAGAGAT